MGGSTRPLPPVTGHGHQLWVERLSQPGERGCDRIISDRAGREWPPVPGAGRIDGLAMCDRDEPRLDAGFRRELGVSGER
jgi:hypothetical protein